MQFHLFLKFIWKAIHEEGEPHIALIRACTNVSFSKKCGELVVQDWSSMTYDVTFSCVPWSHLCYILLQVFEQNLSLPFLPKFYILNICLASENVYTWNYHLTSQRFLYIPILGTQIYWYRVSMHCLITHVYLSSCTFNIIKNQMQCLVSQKLKSTFIANSTCSFSL